MTVILIKISTGTEETLIMCFFVYLKSLDRVNKRACSTLFDAPFFPADFDLSQLL